jgi:predicted amidohydrolase
MGERDGRYTWDTRPSAVPAPSRLKVATCQTPVSHDLAGNLRHVLDLIRQARDAGADVAHFPECALSGYGPATWLDWDGFSWRTLADAVEAVRAEARACGIWVVVGSVWRSEPGLLPTNALLVVDRTGAVAGRYDKRRCSINDLRAFAPGAERPLIVEIDGVRCGFLVCLDWAFPDLWSAYAGRVELVFHSCVADAAGRDRNAAHTIPPLMQGYAWLNQYAVSVANSCRPAQDFPSFWVERSGHAGLRAAADQPGLIVNALADDPKQDQFFAMVRSFRAAAADGSLYEPHRLAVGDRERR